MDFYVYYRATHLSHAILSLIKNRGQPKRHAIKHDHEASNEATEYRQRRAQHMVAFDLRTENYVVAGKRKIGNAGVSEVPIKEGECLGWLH